MASLASRSVGKSKFDGLLVRAAELCAIVRRSYLSPSFPFLLCFELWQYFRLQLPKRRSSWPGKIQSPVAQEGDLKYCRFSCTLRLLRGAAFAITLMLPVKGWAQVQATPGVSALPAAAVFSAQQDGMPSGSGPIFPRTTGKPGVTPDDVEARRAPAHSRSDAELQQTR
jgi:hypothetical protein